MPHGSRFGGRGLRLDSCLQRRSAGVSEIAPARVAVPDAGASASEIPFSAQVVLVTSAILPEALTGLPEVTLAGIAQALLGLRQVRTVVIVSRAGIVAVVQSLIIVGNARTMRGVVDPGVVVAHIYTFKILVRMKLLFMTTLVE
jgi:hypothetical protein